MPDAHFAPEITKALIGYVDEEDAEGENNPLAQIGRKAVEKIEAD